MQEVVDKINLIVRNYSYLELSMLSFERSRLIIAGSEDIMYFHNFEIVFDDVFTVACNTDWKIDTGKDFIWLVTDIEEIRTISLAYRVEKGNSIYRLEDEDHCIYYIVAKTISI